MIDEHAFLTSLFKAIDNHKLTLPTLPEVALRVRDSVEREESTAKSIADIVATDAALSARLLQVANSPLYRGRVAIDNLQMAVARLGTRMVRSLVVSLIMQQIFQPTSEQLDQRFRQAWEESVQVAALSRVLTSNLKHLDREQAMLAGLIHNIGTLPILTMAEHDAKLIDDREELERLIELISAPIGQRILQSWGFPESLIKVPGSYQDLSYDGGELANYVDVVQVARLQTLQGSDHPLAKLDWSRIPSFAKVGIDPEVSVIEIEGVAKDVAEVEVIFLG
ncbi:HD-like signal output (HDOD) domain, no enzymatic activity [endosymbiont of Ridgeia piscesae]|jgi:HD-like signal output (HDOD) protein|uniref:HD-like signal output (HDOD) domain, no enzymatic activity n=3 Tax=endosymbiont of Ridgeia piscesae TaxID=54398 RepID=A0A0T5YZ51_9GAMM|nr:HDOD domain-containing protein [endosymbiont of Ridgeia piscesae]KRT55912.1 HD-like signal output (HDOD) domain, no enzymatic activity [endosymbiont of Ridgeia piscesae]